MSNKIPTMAEVYDTVYNATRYYGMTQVNSIVMDAMIQGEKNLLDDDEMPDELSPN